MVDFETSKKILNKDENYTDEEIKQIAELLQLFADLSVKNYFEHLKIPENEKSDNNGACIE